MNDLYSIIAFHYLHAGSSGVIHFNLLLNALILDINNCSLEELNSVLAILLYKGHDKDKTQGYFYGK